MTRVIKLELVYYNDLAKNLVRIAQQSKNLSINIDTFITNSKDKLVGKSFDVMRDRLQLYLNLYKKLSQITESFYSNMNYVNTKMIHFMQNLSEIDNTRIAEIERRLGDMTVLLDTISNETASEEFEYYTKVLGLLDRRKAQLLGLEPVDRELFNFIEPDVIDIKSFKSTVSEIKPVKISIN